MLPEAIFVDSRRHPMACCFSIYKQNFARGQVFGYGLDSLAVYYRNYLTLMRHWQAVLPGRVHRVIYERLVDDTEGETRRLLAHCDLPLRARLPALFRVRPRRSHRERRTGPAAHLPERQVAMAPIRDPVGAARRSARRRLGYLGRLTRLRSGGFAHVQVRRSSSVPRDEHRTGRNAGGERQAVRRGCPEHRPIQPKAARHGSTRSRVAAPDRGGFALPCAHLNRPSRPTKGIASGPHRGQRHSCFDSTRSPRARSNRGVAHPLTTAPLWIEGGPAPWTRRGQPRRRRATRRRRPPRVCR